jgi:hypothetical protein
MMREMAPWRSGPHSEKTSQDLANSRKNLIGYNGLAVKRWLQVDQAEFNELHTSCVTALAVYVVEAEKTAEMLAKCTPEPLPLVERVKVTVQETAENSAHLLYLAAKRLLHDAARLGYAFSS